VAKVNIFYQELNYRTVDEAPVYSVSGRLESRAWAGDEGRVSG
jgi:hypothetical protein